jgi:dienelactone hydrolase
VKHERIIVVLVIMGLSILILGWRHPQSLKRDLQPGPHSGTQTRDPNLGIGESVCTTIPGERIEIKSISPISAEQVLDKKGREDKITGYLTIPANVKGKVPTVIIKHCGAGPKDWKDLKYAKALNKWGYATFVVDSWELRKLDGLTRRSGKDKVIPLVDIYSALKVLSSDPRIDADRIAVLGWANSAQAILASQISKIRQIYSDGNKFAAAIAIQPVNVESWWVSKDVEKTPTLILCGEKDIFALCDACSKYKELMNKAGGNINIISYPSAVHQWDKEFASPGIAPELFDTRGCFVLFNVDNGSYELDGRTVGKMDVLSHYEKGLVKGAPSGWNKNAASKALEDVREFLEKHLK